MGDEVNWNVCHVCGSKRTARFVMVDNLRLWFCGRDYDALVNGRIDLMVS
jgi:hypothetical protein